MKRKQTKTINGQQDMGESVVSIVANDSMSEFLDK